MILLWVFLPVPVSLATVGTSNLSCPTWFYYSNATQRCECGLQIGYWVRCNQQTMEVEIMNSICMTYFGQEGLFYIRYCSLSYKFNHTNRLYSRLPSDPDLLEEMMCGPYNRKGFCVESASMDMPLGCTVWMINVLTVQSSPLSLQFACICCSSLSPLLCCLCLW